MSVVKKLKRDVGDFIVDISDWEILDQGVTVLWGPSGAGKTTVLNTLAGLEEGSELSWIWKDQDLGKLSTEQRGLGVVFQELGLFPHLTVRKNILFPISKSKHPHWENDLIWLTETLELQRILDSEIQVLSGGEKQRVALARALIYRPRMLLLDEPFSSLDEKLRQKTREMVLKASQHLNCPVLLITHDRQDVEVMADKVSKIAEGRIFEESSSL